MAKADERQFFPSGVRIVTNNRIVYQGQLQAPPPFFPTTPFPVSNQFIFLLLNCPPEFITATGTLVTIEPVLFRAGELVRIDVRDIVLGPSGECIAEEAASATRD